MFEFIIAWGCGEKLNSKHSPGAARVTVGQARSPASRPDGASFGSFGGRGDKLIARLRLRVGAGVYKARRRSVLVECSGKQILKGGREDEASASPSAQEEIIKANALHFFQPVSGKRPAQRCTEPKSARSGA